MYVSRVHPVTGGHFEQFWLTYLFQWRMSTGFPSFEVQKDEFEEGVGWGE